MGSLCGMIRPANKSDVPLIAALIRELAEYEKMSHLVSLDERELAGYLFGERPFAQVLIAEERDDGGVEPAGFALFFHNFSTFLGKPGIYIEDLFVRPRFRGRGHGKALLAQIAVLARASGCGRVEWAVLDWNKPAQAFYERLGAAAMKEWTIYRLAGDALYRLARVGEDAERR